MAARSSGKAFLSKSSHQTSVSGRTPSGSCTLPAAWTVSFPRPAPPLGFSTTRVHAPGSASFTSKSAVNELPSRNVREVGRSGAWSFFSRRTVAAGSKPSPETAIPSAGLSSRTFLGFTDFTRGAGPNPAGER